MLQAKMKWAGGLKFEGDTAFGHKIVTDGAKKAGGGEEGYKPTELILFSLIGCTGIDVVLILKKMRQQISGVEIEVTASQPDQYPKPFNKIDVKYIFRGKELNRDKVEQAVKLSEEKYCAVSLTLRGVARISSSIEIIEE
jgi:putative redox protein